jgi:hypothetical protein
MRAVGLLVLLSACGSTGPDLTLTTQFTIAGITGAGMSPLDPLLGQTIDVEVVIDHANANHGDGNDPAGCKTTVAYAGNAKRTARGSTSALVQREILDRLPDWDFRLQLCDSASSSFTAVAVINELNLAFGCNGIPASARARGADGSPELTSFTATQCRATILDVVNNRDLSNADFAMTIVTGPEQIP